MRSDTLINTFDGIYREGDVCTYTSVLYLAALAALEELATAHGNTTLVTRAAASKKTALAAVERLLWTGTHYRGFACDPRAPGQANVTNDLNVQGDSLYGQLWASILGLDTGLDPAKLRSHLGIERAWATTEDGVRLFSNRTTDYACRPMPTPMPDFQGYPMSSFWNAHIVDSAAVRLALNTTAAQGSWDAMLAVATRKWRDVLRDQWDIRDLDWRNDTEAAAKVPGAAGAGVRPFVNSHYSRQLLGIWAIVRELSGLQRHDLAAGELRFATHGEGARARGGAGEGTGGGRARKAGRWPFFSATANGHIEELGGRGGRRPGTACAACRCFEVAVLGGNLRARVFVDGEALAPDLALEAAAGQHARAVACTAA